MLVVTRKQGEKVVFETEQGRITVTLLPPKNDGRKIGPVRVGIEAPKEIPIYREEILRRKESNEAER